MLVIFPLVIVADLVSKSLIENKYSLGENAKIIPGFIKVTVVHNDGAAWSLFSGMKVLLIIVTIAFLITLLWFFFTKNSLSKTLGVAVGFIVGGSIGNLFDRIKYGYVRDFLDFEFINFPVFNIADICLTIGIFLFVVYLLFIYPKELKKTHKEK